jgi:hypothetical protein
LPAAVYGIRRIVSGVEPIAATTTKTGLTVRSELD